MILTAVFIGLLIGLFFGYRLGIWRAFYRLGARERQDRINRIKPRQ